MSRVQGEAHHAVKISDEKVREIRKTFGEWKLAGSSKGYRDLADAFGISMWTARDLVTYRTRKSA